MSIEEAAIIKITDLVFEKYRKSKEDGKEKITNVQFAPDRFSYTELNHGSTENRV